MALVVGLDVEQCATRACLQTQRLHGASTNALWKTNWVGRVWQSGCYDRLLKDDGELIAAGEYLMLNPVRKGWVASPEDWRWSGWIDDLNDPAPSR